MEESYKRAVKSLNGRLITPYQHEGVAWLLARELDDKRLRGGILTDEMGLGKTVQLIAMMLGNPLRRTLIVVPKSVVTQWESEIKRFAPNLSVYVHTGPNRTHNKDDLRAAVTITTYGCCVVKSTKNNPISKSDVKPTVLHGIKWDRIILDEGHEIREAKSKISRSIKLMIGYTKWVVTGTPVFNSMKDFASISNFVGIKTDVVQSHTEAVRNIYVLRRTKADLAQFNNRLELPPCDFQNVEISMNAEEEALYMKAFDSGSDTIRTIMASAGNANMHTMEFLKCLLRVRQVMAWPQLFLDGEEIDQKWAHSSTKMDTLFNMISEHQNEKTLIFCQFIGELDHIQSQLTCDIYRIDGSICEATRNAQIDKFKQHKGGCVFLLQIKAGGVGLNLQDATRIYIMSPSWNPATELQAIGRAHRTGQTKKVYVRKFIYTGKEGIYNSVEQSMLELQGAKSKITSDVLNDPRIEKQLPGSAQNGAISIRQIRKIFSV